ncbi:cytochrome c oxidase assembly protein [Glycomyces tarimensis]
MTAHGTGSPSTHLAAALVLIFAVAAGYLWAASRDRDGWSRWRTAAWLGGCATAGLAVSPLVDAEPEPVVHMARHLMLGMVAPIGLALGAPVTLLLRTLPTASGRRLTRVLRARPIRWLGHPFAAATLNVGGLYAVMLTPLHAAASQQPLLHGLVLAHYLAAGYLFTWSIIGPDPAPHRPGTATRAVALAAAVAAHAFLARYLYAHTLPVGHDPQSVRAAAQLMYYVGDLADLVIAVILFGTWYRGRARRDQVAKSSAHRLA